MLEIQNDINIEKMIYEIRGKQVMLDSDLSKLYQCKNGTKAINQAVKRHQNRFPKDFCFQLTQEEHKSILRSQIVTLKSKQGEHTKYIPYVFTEQGVAMLATVLRIPVASETNVKIMCAFVEMRKYISTSLLEQKYINNQVMKNTEDIKELQEFFKYFDKQNEPNKIFFKGEIYDSYSLLIDIFNKAKNNIIIIDNYIDKKFLDVCAKIKVDFLIYTNKINKADLEKYNKQYNNVTITLSNEFHDRFVIIDNTTLFHCGASLKDLGKKCFAINKIENNNILRELLKVL